MRKFMILAAMVVACVGCKTRYDVSERVRFEVDLLAVERESMSPSRAVADDVTLQQASMTDLWVFEGTELLAHQQSSQPGFGSPEVELTYGDHDLTFVASNQSGQTFSAGTWHADKANDCYGTVHHLSVGGGTPTQSVVLGRCSYGLKWQSTDMLPAAVRKLRLRVSPMSESLTQGLQATNGYEREWTYDVSSRVGTVISVTVYGLPEQYNTECNISTTIEWLGTNDAVLYTHTKQVPVKSNRMTIISGAMFTTAADASVRINSDWEEPYEENL